MSQQRMSRWAIAAVLPLALVTAAPAAADGAGCDSAWRAVALPSDLPGRPFPVGVSVQGDGTVFVLLDVQVAGEQRTAVARWSSGTWQASQLFPSGSRLRSIVSHGAQAWALGSDAGGSDLQHWYDGAWHRETLPAQAGQPTSLSVVDEQEVWISSWSSYTEQLVLRRSHGVWSTWRLPSLNGAIDAVSPTDVWVAGSVPRSTEDDDPVAWHWDGQTWQREAVSEYSFGDGVTATPSGQVWSWGNTYVINCCNRIGSVWHRSGRRWVSVGDLFTEPADLQVDRTGTDVTVVGGYFAGDGGGGYDRASIQRLEHGTWVTEPVLGLGPDGLLGRLVDVDGNGRGERWAVGGATSGPPGSALAPLVLRRCRASRA